MSEPFPSMDDPVNWNDWLQPDEAFWASTHSHVPTVDSMNSAPFTLGTNLADPQPLESQYDAVEPNSSLAESLSLKTVEHGQQHIEEPIEPIEAPKDFTLTKKLVYLRTTCASCDGPLDRSEEDLLDIEEPSLRCAQHDSVGHLPLACQEPECRLKFVDLKALKKHSQGSKHKGFHCAVPKCHISLANVVFSISEHFRLSHPDIKFQCAKCSKGFNSHEQLNDHCNIEQHAGYVCRYPLCGSETLRLADLHRHQLTHKTNIARHPCPHCREYRGKNGFKRKDHLLQHIRNYHHIHVEREFRCPLERCSSACYALYGTLELLTEHTQSKHESLPYFCKEKGCDRIGMNGFDNDNDLKLHVKESHLPPYQCSFPGCDRVREKGWKRARDMVKHMEKKHGHSAVGDSTL